jgi:hypothetical protein
MSYAYARPHRAPVLATHLFSFDRLTVRVAVIALTVLMGLLYVVQMNLTATKGYEIRELEREVVTLESQARELQFQSMQLQSMDRLLSQVGPETLVKANPDSFVHAGVTTVAAR